MNWQSTKPDLNQECILVTANLKNDGNHDYSIWEIKQVVGVNGPYMALSTIDGREYDDLSVLSADRYLILQKPI